MTETTTPPVDGQQPDNGFIIYQGTLSGRLTTPSGAVYDIRKLEPREVTDPRSGATATIWGGYAAARDLDLAARDAMMQAEFKKTGKRPEAFDARSSEIPLYITLRAKSGKGYDLIGTFWTSEGRHTVFARDVEGKGGLRFGGNVVMWKPKDAPAADASAEPNAEAAREGAEGRARKGRAKTPRAET